MNRFRPLSLIVSAVLLAVIACSTACRCEKEPVSKGSDDSDTRDTPQEPRKEPAHFDPADLKALVQGNNQFALDLYTQFAKSDGNVIFSPYSVSTTLAIAYAGARGDTADQMSRVLHFALPQDRLHSAFAGLAWKLQAKEKEPPDRLEVANALWSQSGLPVEKEFREVLFTHYGASLTPVDFQNDSNGARQTINRWVAKRTHDRIKELVSADDVGQNTRLVLSNAAHFKAAWRQPFSKDQTREEVFEIAPGNTVKVQMMHYPNGRFNYHAAENFQMLELPYVGDRISMIILLPSKKNGLTELERSERSLTAKRLDESLSRLSVHTGPVALPQFKFHFRRQLREDLEALGMLRPFRAGADFSGINAAGFVISKVVHQAWIGVDEQGTEAAAATAVTFGILEPPPFSFRADHPFIFILRDKQTGTILFLGRVRNPEPIEFQK